LTATANGGDNFDHRKREEESKKGKIPFSPQNNEIRGLVDGDGEDESSNQSIKSEQYFSLSLSYSRVV
jgi:hypothetical protein